MPRTYKAPSRYYKGQASSAFVLKWRGKEIEDAVRAATIEAMHETLREAVMLAREYAPFDTGALRDDIDYQLFLDTPKRVTARFGNFDVRYSIFQNWGTVHIPAVYYLERAADREFPQLASRVKKHLANG